MIILGWLMLAGGVIGVASITFFIWPDPSGSETEQQIYNGFSTYLYGAALLTAILGALLLKANGVELGWP